MMEKLQQTISVVLSHIARSNVTGVFIGILLLFLVILAIGYAIVNFSIEFVLPIILTVLIFGIYQLIIYIIKP
jgi:hypothetical protein